MKEPVRSGANPDGPDKVPPALACPRCGNSDMDMLRLHDAPAEGDEDLDRETVSCERCGLRYRLP